MDTNIKYLVDNGINIWNKDAYNYFKSQLSDEWYELKSLTLEEFVEAIKNGETKYNFSDYKLGDLGRVYGAQWRKWDLGMSRKSYLDQISNLIKNLKEQPMSRRHIVTAWNPAELDDMALPPCHWSFEIIVEPLQKECGMECTRNCKDYCKNSNYDYGFTLKWHQRSVDTYLG